MFIWRIIIIFQFGIYHFNFILFFNYKMDKITKNELIEKAKEIQLIGYYKYNKKELYDILYNLETQSTKSPR